MNGTTPAYISDGEYEDLIFGGTIRVSGGVHVGKWITKSIEGNVEIPKSVAIVKYKGNVSKRMYNEILDERRS